MEEANFQSEIPFSESVSNKRIQSACRLIGVKTVHRILGITLFWLGGNREKICEFLNIPMGTFFSFLNRFQRDGLKALEDQRERADKPKSSHAISQNLELIFGERKVVIKTPSDINRLIVDPSNVVQFKTLILSFMNSGFLSIKEVSEQLGISERHVRDLNKNLRADDVEALFDKRRGQRIEYAFNESVKAEIIQQFVVNLVNRRSIVSSKITQQVNEACQTSLSERAMRQHLSKLGLHKIKESLPTLLEDVKKSSKP